MNFPKTQIIKSYFSVKMMNIDTISTATSYTLFWQCLYIVLGRTQKSHCTYKNHNEIILHFMKNKIKMNYRYFLHTYIFKIKLNGFFLL